jgi:PAS domain S-box-containing protein
MENSREKQRQLDSSKDHSENSLHRVHEGKLCEVFERMSDGFYAVGRDWRFTYVNRRAEKLWNRSKEELLGKNIWQEFPQAVGSEYYQQINRAMEEDVPTEFETASLVLNTWVAGRAYPSADGLSVYFQDITERRRAEETLQESNRRMENILESITEDFFAVDREWRYTYINEQALRRIRARKGEGVSREELMGKSVWEVFPEAVGSVFYEKYHEAVREQKTVHFEGYLPLTEEWYVCFAYPLKEGLAVYYRDTTERQRAVKRLQEAEEKYRSLFENAVEGIFQTTVGGRLLTANPALARIAGYESPEELIADVSDLSRQIHANPEGRAEFVSLVRQHGAVTDYEHQIRRKDGTLMWLSSSARAIRDADGDLIGFEGRVVDISERKRAEEELRLSEERFRAQYKSFPVPTFSWRRVRDDFELTDYNEAADQITRGGLKRLLGMKASEWYSDNPQILEMLWRCISEGIVIKEEIPWQMRTTDEHKHFAVTFAPVPPDLVMHHAEDITERKETEEALRLRAELLDLSYEPIFTWELEGDIVYWNRGAEDLYGFSKQEAVGRESHRLLQTTHPIPLEEFKHVLERDGQWIGELEHTAHDGRKVIVESRHMLVPTARDRRLVLETNYDITERKRLEENQQRFLTNAAHQLKTPITTIVGAAELLVTKENLDVAKRRQLLDHIFSEGNHLQRLSGTLLRLARVGWDQREPSPEMVDLAAAARQAAERITPLAEAAGLSLHVEGNGACVLADPEWLQEVLLVLLSNAMKHSKSGQNISLWARESTITVEDEGAGISPMDLPHVFERFYRGKGSSEGFGLGLPICRELVERMGGYINLSSGEEVGTTVKIELPEAGVGA